LPLTEALDVTFEVARIFESLGVDYLVGGSMASSLHGVPRATLDVDLVADLQPEHVRPLISALEPRFYVSHEAVREAVVHRSSFNIIEQQRVFKVDVFVLKNDEQGVLKVRGPLLDREYLRSRAARMGLGELLDRAFGEADRPSAP
jgi:hypothetical protein